MTERRYRFLWSRLNEARPELSRDQRERLLNKLNGDRTLAPLWLPAGSYTVPSNENGQHKHDSMGRRASLSSSYLARAT
jgi:hypothetical protein